MLKFFGHLHPLIVHLPLGILTLAVFMEGLMAYKSRNSNGKLQEWRSATDFAFLAGAVTGLLSCLFGYMLSLVDQYDEEIIGRHQWMGIALSCFSGLVWYLRRKMTTDEAYTTIQWRYLHAALVVIVALLLMITGHLGGTLTHGDGYLSKPFFAIFGVSETPNRKPITNIQEAKVYQDLVLPVLEDKCYSCHSSKKQKGDLRLDSPDAIMKGGETGEILVQGDPKESDLMKRALLPLRDDDHMPPKGKPQLTSNEIALVHWWIEQSASFDKQVKHLTLTTEAKKALAALQQGEKTHDIWANPDVPRASVGAAPLQNVQKLRDLGAIVLPVAQESPYLSINFINAPSITDSQLEALKSVAPNIAWLKLNNAAITDNGLATIAQLPNLTRLSLVNTQITDLGMKQVANMAALRHLNLMQTQVSDAGVTLLRGLKQLKSLYVYQSKVTQNGLNQLHSALPNCTFDAGNYQMPFLASDTVHYRDKPKTK